MGVIRDFEMFLSQLGTVPENKIKFYIHLNNTSHFV